MKKILFISIMMLAIVAASCNGSSGNSSAQDSVEAQSLDSIATESQAVDNALPVANAPELKVGNNGKAASEKPGLEKPQVPVKAETATDRLLKQYNAELLSLIEASQSGKGLSNDAAKKFLDLQNELNELEKSGKLSDTQKDLFKVTSDAYAKLKTK